jgi:DNA repair exonuclease SbcCD nuclease subunit
MIRKYIGLLADTQLDKRLYGLEDTRRDWFRALEQGFESLYAVKEELSAIFVLGDIFDAESVGSEAAFSFQSALAKFAKEDIPILLILGNHDSNPSKSINWISVCKLVNPHVVELNFKEPFTLPAEGNLSAINVLGNNNLSRDRMADALKTLIQPSTAGINWLCLHQALAELAPHPDAFDVM